MPSIGKAGNDSVTVQRLLEAAAHEFARHGYVAARIRDIVDAAGVNLAAVNYHFGGKEGLYRATLAMLAKRAREDMPADSPEIRSLPPEEQLRTFARVTLARYLGGEQASPASRIIAYELLDPTPAFGWMLHETSGPQWARLLEIVSALLGPRATQDDIAFASLSVAGQWVFFLFGRRMFELQFPAIAGNPGLVDRLADHIASFSIAAINAKRAQLEAGPAKRGPSRARPATAREPNLARSRPIGARVGKGVRSGK